MAAVQRIRAQASIVKTQTPAPERGRKNEKVVSACGQVVFAFPLAREVRRGSGL
jgi:hypothetical protein